MPANAVRIRNLCLMAEGIQNDLRQTFLFFTPDFCNPRYRSQPWFADVVSRLRAVSRRGLSRNPLGDSRKAKSSPISAGNGRIPRT